MSDITTVLDAISTELSGLRTTPPATVPMTLDAFQQYCDTQIKLAKADANPAPRISALIEVVRVAKAHGWESLDTMQVPAYPGDVGETAAAEKMDVTLATPGQVAPPTGTGGFEAAATGPTGPATNTAAPAMRAMPPTFPQSTPAGAGEGWLAKAQELLAKSTDAALRNELTALLTAAGSKDAAIPVAKHDDDWPLDLATPAFLTGAKLKPEDDFGGDPRPRV